MTAPRRRRRSRQAYAKEAIVVSAVAVAALGIVHGVGSLGLSQAVRIGIGVLGAVWLPYAARSLAEASADGRAPARSRAGAAGSLPLAVRLRARPLFARFDRVGRLRRVGRTRRSEPPEDWEITRALVRLSESSAIEFHTRIRPRVATVARHRLAAAGIDPSDRGAVLAAIGEVGAAVLDPSVAPPRDREAAGVPAAALVSLLRRLEELG